jgi:hypothetical protein
MNVQRQRRAEIALRSLSKTERKQLEHILDTLTPLSSLEFYQNPNIDKLTSGSGRTLYVLKGTLNLRIILSVNAETCMVEDIFDHNDLEQLPFFKQAA